MSYLPSQLPTGFDLADGLEGRLGTPTPAGQVEVDNANGSGLSADQTTIEDDASSLSIERAEQATFQRSLNMSLAEALNRIQFHYRGAVRQDSQGYLYKTLSARLQRVKGDQATLSLTEEAASFDSPPDEFEIVPVELGINIIKHPRYFYAFLGDGYGSTTEQRNQMVIRLLQDYMANPNYNFRNSITKMLKDSLGSETGVGDQPPKASTRPDADGYYFGSTAKVSGTDLAKTAALEIITKFWRGEETPYIVGVQIIWSVFTFTPPAMNLGGYVEDPILDATPQLPEYFFSTTYPPTFGSTIFDQITSWNPQCYSTNGLPGGPLSISWLRKADVIEFQRTWFKHTRTWIGSPVGHWDEDLYNNAARPLSAADYREVL